MSRNAFSAADIECEWSQSKKICLRERERERERETRSEFKIQSESYELVE